MDQGSLPDFPPASVPVRPRRETTPQAIHIGMTAKSDKIAVAMMKVQGAIYAPPRNKTVKIQPRNGLPYEFSYTTLDVILEMLKQPNLDQGLLIVHLTAPGPKETLMVTRVMHAQSGQYMESVYPLMGGDSIQGWGSAMTYMRRYAICAMFNIASDDDNDASEAVGNGVYVPVSGEDAERYAKRMANERHSRLIAECNGARSASGVKRMLTVWGEGLYQYLGYRDQPDYAEQWTAVLGLTTDALGRVFGGPIAELWRAILTATTPEDLAAVRAMWERPDVIAAKKAMAAADKEVFSRFNLQLAEIAKRVESAPPAVTVEPAPTSVKEVFQAPPPSPEASQDAADEFPLHDEIGAITSEPSTDPVEFATAYMKTRRFMDTPEELANLAEHNAFALAWAGQNPEAARLLDDGMTPSLQDTMTPSLQEASPPRDLRVPMATRSGVPDLMGFATSVQRSLDEASKAEWPGWLDQNREQIDGLPQGTRLRIKGLIARRAEQLGVSAV